MTETLIPRLTRKDIREYTTVENDLIIARKVDVGTWLVTAHSADLGAQVQGTVTFNEGGFRGRQWEAQFDGQQYSSLMEALREVAHLVRVRADSLAFARANGICLDGGAFRVPGDPHPAVPCDHCPTCG